MPTMKSVNILKLEHLKIILKIYYQQDLPVTETIIIVAENF